MRRSRFRFPALRGRKAVKVEEETEERELKRRTAAEQSKDLFVELTGVDLTVEAPAVEGVVTVGDLETK